MPIWESPPVYRPGINSQIYHPNPYPASQIPFSLLLQKTPLRDGMEFGIAAAFFTRKMLFPFSENQNQVFSRQLPKWKIKSGAQYPHK
jgi:hypothetical protein